MKFEDFIEKGLARKSSRDYELSKALIAQLKIDMEFLDGLEINEKSSRRLMSNYYDLLRSVLEAISSVKGYKIYSHEAFTYFLKENSEELLSVKFDRFRRIRNAINYYGEEISTEETKENIKEIKKMINFLKNKYLKELDK
jgi:hypothetical protein